MPTNEVMHTFCDIFPKAIRSLFIGNMLVEIFTLFHFFGIVNFICKSIARDVTVKMLVVGFIANNFCKQLKNFERQNL